MSPRTRERVYHSHDQDEVPMVKQSEAAACDINNIMKKYELGGEIQHINKAVARYGDFSTGQDFTQAYTAVAQAEAAFDALPAHIRDKFGNNPEVFLYKMEDPEFRKQLELDGVYDPEAGPNHEPMKSDAVLATVEADRKLAVERQTSEAKAPVSKPDGTVQGGE